MKRKPKKIEPYALGTSVPIMQTRGEIERTLERYGATDFAQAEDPARVFVQFKMKGRSVRFTMLKCSGNNAAAVERENRRLWRSLLLSIKSKLEVSYSGIETFEDAFMAHFVLPDGKTVGEHMRPQLEQVYGEGRTAPPLLPLFQ